MRNLGSDVNEFAKCWHCQTSLMRAILSSFLPVLFESTVDFSRNKNNGVTELKM